MAIKVAFKGTSMTLVGRRIKEGMPGPDFKVVDGDSKEVTLSDFKGKTKLITTYLSLDTPVCDGQLKEFNKQIRGAFEDVLAIGISKDLPFASKRFCAMNEIEDIKAFSDYKTSSFGINYGLLIKEANLLGRSVIILDKNDVIRYIQVVNEMTRAPDYDDALKRLSEVEKIQKDEKVQEAPRCKACAGFTEPLSGKELEDFRSKVTGWELLEGKKLVKEFKFADFAEAKYFLDLLCVIAQEQGHHPNFNLIYNKLRVSLTTHAAGGLTENDFIMAKIIDEVNL
ncbi:MAG: thiol peroxidase [Candidatus Omnitrophica bacterium]|nr:thiol peroxidase [Candidatus Omnitrophota bacterium]MDD5552264.1 thiol peroxidase [Candidatus Omnitrophota bacterium]